MLLDILILNGRDALIDFFYFLRDDIHSSDLVMLSKEGGNTEANIAGTGYSDFKIIKISHNCYVYSTLRGLRESARTRRDIYSGAKLQLFSELGK